MKKRTMFLIVAFCLSVIAASYASDANVGSWKLNDSKSKVTAGAPKNTSVVYTAEGDSYKCVTDGVDGSGKPTHTEWTGMFDGKDYPVTGDSNADTRSVKKVSDRHYTITNKKGGKSTLTGTVDFSADGKQRTLKTESTSADGKKMSSTIVYDRQ
jgi:hypothetical protein